MDRESILEWFDRALSAVDPRSLTAANLTPTGEDTTVIAIGKAAAAMCRGAADSLGTLRGICVTGAAGEVPDGVRLVIGDHPVPLRASLEAGRMVLETAKGAGERCVVLISGGGSALCEHPLPGVDPGFIAMANRALLTGGASIGDTNLVRSHLSAIKGGGVARAVGRPVETLILSDVAGQGPKMVASGPTIDMGHHPRRALALLRHHGVEVPDAIAEAVRAPRSPTSSGEVIVIGDGHTAARALTEAARADGYRADIDPEWIGGPVEEALERFLEGSAPGVTVAAGEPEVRVTGGGAGGRCTHTALLAAVRLSGTGDVFAALASDGVDGASGSAGAVVDGTTASLGGDTGAALADSDSAGYLGRTGSLAPGGPTGTNVGDLWVVCRR